MLNVVAIMGRLVADPELRTTQNGTNVCSFRIACDRNFARQGEQRQADFIDIVAWRQQAEFVSKYFQKGSLIAIEGSLQTRQYQDKNGNNRTAVEVVANNVNFAGPKSNGSSHSDSSRTSSQTVPLLPPRQPGGHIRCIKNIISFQMTSLSPLYDFVCYYWVLVFSNLQE